MYSAVISSSPVSTKAEKFSNLPCPYGCFSSAGWSETRTERKVIIAAIKSRPECNASESTPRLPVRITRNAFRHTSSSAEPTLSNAARFFSQLSSLTRTTIIVRLAYLNSAHGAGSRCCGIATGELTKCFEYAAPPLARDTTRLTRPITANQVAQGKSETSFETSFHYLSRTAGFQ